MCNTRNTKSYNYILPKIKVKPSFSFQKARIRFFKAILQYAAIPRFFMNLIFLTAYFHTLKFEITLYTLTYNYAS